MKNRLARPCGEAKNKQAHESWADIPVQSIDDTMIENWIQIERGKHKWSDKTAKHYLNDITQVLEHAKKQKWVVRNKLELSVHRRHHGRGGYDRYTRLLGFCR